MDYRGEQWKEYPFDEERTNDLRLFFSNFGRVKSYNSRCPEGRIIKGSMREGYPIISTRLFKKRDTRVQDRIDEYNLRISLISQEIKELKKLKDLPQDILETRLAHLDNLRTNLVKKRQKYTLSTDKKRTIHLHVLVHRAVAELFLTKNSDDDVVIHKDFVKTNNHVSNLEWKSKEEAFERYKKNPYYTSGKYIRDLRSPNRKQSKNAKLTENQVLYIKEKLSQGKTLKELARKFGVSDMQIHRIKTGENWSSVKTVKELNDFTIGNKKWQAT